MAICKVVPLETLLANYFAIFVICYAIAVLLVEIVYVLALGAIMEAIGWTTYVVA